MGRPEEKQNRRMFLMNNVHGQKKRFYQWEKSFICCLLSVSSFSAYWRKKEKEAICAMVDPRRY
jgi:hypothetical protein